MAAGRANEAALWLENYRFERQFGDAKHCRKVLQRALNSVSDWPESIVDAFINFERLEGTFEQYEQAVAKCEAQMARIRERREKESAQQDQPRHDKKGQKKGFDRKGGQKGKKQFEKPQQKSQNQNKPNKRKGEGDTPSEIKNIQPYKRKNESMDTPEEGFKVPLPVAAKFTKSAPPPGYKGAGEVVQPETPPSNGDQAAPPATEGSSKVVPTPGVKRPLEKSAPPPGYRADKEQDQEPPEKKIKTDSEAKVQFSEQANYTIFVSNLNYKVDEDNIRDFFKKCGQIEEIRLIKNFKGQSKGYGYVQFADQLSVSNALAYDRTAMEGRPMYVSRYEERGETKSKADFKYGELKGVRLVTYRSGASKGLAYIEYVDEQTASQALLKTDGLQVGEHTIEVAISNPPARKAQFSQREETSFVPTLGGGKKETLSRGVARTQVMLMPRSVSKKPISSKPAPGSSQNKDTNPSDTGNKTGMSNSDFRNMLLKKSEVTRVDVNQNVLHVQTDTPPIAHPVRLRLPEKERAVLTSKACYFETQIVEQDMISAECFKPSNP
ncbi:SART3-like protein [Mya arenaria]|uniref:SART3-like protein n=1 Tax=Mya arenaria TaxID=6604 RepID=A0ABY7DZR8_MYAAR|nr:SART3-like protein [Mya arenaria]